MTIHLHIERTHRKILKIEKQLDGWYAKYQPPEHCCVTCAMPEITKIQTAQAVRIETILRLLKKRNSPEDKALILEMKALYKHRYA